MDGRGGRWWIVGLLGIYLILAAILPAIDDEVYYWCWSKDLQWSYYDHPPMTAVLIRLSTSLFGDSVFGFRVPACIASAFVVYVISRLTPCRPLVLGVVLSPLFTLGAVLITPDSPLVMCWAAYLWWLIELQRRLTPTAVDVSATSASTNNELIHEPTSRGASDDFPAEHRGESRSQSRSQYSGTLGELLPLVRQTVTIQWWLLGGVILGCGVLSKYTMGLAVPTAFISLLLACRPWRQWLPGYIFHGVIAFAVASPILIYNIGQEFEPILFQLRHSAQKSPNALRSFGDFVGVQILLFGTMPFFLLPWAIFNVRRLCQDPLLRVCACLYVLPLTFFLYKSTQTRLEGNWAFVCFISVWPVASVWYASVRDSRYWRWSTALAFVPPSLVVVLGIVHLIHPISIVPIYADRVYRQIAINAATREVARQIREIDSNAQPPVYADSYQMTALLRFQSLDARQVDGASRPSHFTRPPRHLTDVDGAYFVGGQPLPEKFTTGFDPPRLVASVPVEIRGVTENTLRVWRYTRQDAATTGVE